MKRSKNRSGRSDTMMEFEPTEKEMRLGQHMWGAEALEAVAQLVVLEPAADLPRPRAANQQLNLIAAHIDETSDEFLHRVGARLKRISVPVMDAFLCLNGDTGWKATLSRIGLARRIAASLSISGGQLWVLSPQTSDAQVSLELLTLVELVRRGHPGLNIHFRTGTGAEPESDTSDNTPSQYKIRFEDLPRATDDVAA
jgi:hypothetical protein